VTAATPCHAQVAIAAVRARTAQGLSLSRSNSLAPTPSGLLTRAGSQAPAVKG
jgi:hypothetical protein